MNDESIANESTEHAPLSDLIDRWREGFLSEPTHELRLHSATCQLATLVGASRCSIFVPLGASGLRVLASSELAEVGDLIVALGRYPELKHVLRLNTPLLVESVRHSSLLAPVLPMLQRAGVVSLAAVPLTMHGVRGVLKAISRDRAFDHSTIEVLTAAATALERLPAEPQDDHDPSWTHLLLRIADAVVDVSAGGLITRISGATDPDPLLPQIHVGDTLEDLFQPSDRPTLTRFILDLFSGQSPPTVGPLKMRSTATKGTAARLTGLLLPTTPPSVRIAVQAEPTDMQEDLFDQAPVALIRLDQNETVRRVNRKATSLLGDTEHTGRLDSWLHSDTTGQTYIAGVEPPVPVKVLDPGDGERIVALIDLRPWKDVLERQRRLRSTLQAQIHELEELNRRLEEADVVKARFLSSSAHELKTPLTIIQSYLEILVSDLAEGMSEEQLSFLHVSYESVLRLKRLVVHLVDIAALESGKLPVEMMRVHLGELLEELCTEMAPLALSMQVNLEKRLPTMPAVRADPQRMSQVMRNLIENAIRFTPPGGTVTLTSTDGQPEGDDTVTVAVRDTGIGIPFEQQDIIFEEFAQASRPPNGRPLGAGLGLSIGRRLIQLLGGSIEVDSIEGEGSTFTIRIPRWPDETP